MTIKKRYYYNNKRVSKGEKEIITILNKFQINFLTEYSFPDLISKKGKPLRFDFYIDDYNLLIEFQGEHHFKPVNKFQRAQRVHIQTVEHDKLKWEYSNKNSINLICIHYKDFKNLNKILYQMFWPTNEVIL